MTHSSLGRQPMSAQPRPYSIRAFPDAGAGAGSGQRGVGAGETQTELCFVCLFCVFVLFYFIFRVGSGNKLKIINKIIIEWNRDQLWIVLRRTMLVMIDVCDVVGSI